MAKNNIFFLWLLVAAATPVVADDLDAALSGFDEEVAVPTKVAESDSGSGIAGLSGSLVANASYNYLSHKDNAGTDYEGLSRLRTQLNLQYDHDLSETWQARVGAFVFYDFFYTLQDERNFTDEVEAEYRDEVEFRESWVQGKLSQQSDIKIGRQVVNWGRSESLRVLDLLNPVDNREMGMADIENLRLPVFMVKGDLYQGLWNHSLIVIPEVRFSKNPVYGNDFYTTDPALVIDREDPESIKDSSWAAAARGSFSGWDLSFHAARLWNDRPYAKPLFTSPPPVPGMPLIADRWQLLHSRITMVGVGGNLSSGSWIIKGESAWISGLDYMVTERANLTAFGMGIIDNPAGTEQHDRFDLLLGVEYYGLANTVFSFDLANRHLLDFDKSLKTGYASRDSVEMAFRVNRNFLNERLKMTLLLLSLGAEAENGSIARLTMEYALRDALNLTVGAITYQDGDLPPFDQIEQNDRLFTEIKWNF